MKTKKNVIILVTSIVLIGVMVGAVALYGALNDSWKPEDLPVLKQPGQQGGGTETASTPGQQDGGISKPLDGQGNDAERIPSPDVNDGNPENISSPEPPNEATPTPSEEPDMEDYRAPDFIIQDANGNDISLSDMIGKPIVLNFWASWCPPCKSEMPEFDKVYGELGDDIQFMMICLVDGGRETVATGAAYVEDNEYSFPVFYDVYQDAAVAYSVRSIPATYFIDAGGYLITGAQGAINEETLRRGIRMIN